MIAMYLQRYHDIAISISGVWRILHHPGPAEQPGRSLWKENGWKAYREGRLNLELDLDGSAQAQPSCLIATQRQLASA